VKKNIIIILKIFLIILASLSLAKGIYNSYLYSHDFQYSPTVMAWSGQNHYQYMLDGGALMLSQNGEYGQALHIIFYPFTLLSWDKAKILWMFINVILAFFLPIFLSKKISLDNEKIFYLLAIFLAGTPSRNVIGNGQLSLVMMSFLILPFFYQRTFQIILSGIVYLKYNIGYMLFLYFLSKKEIKNIFNSSIIFILGWLIYCFITNSNLVTNFAEPLRLTFHLKQPVN